MKKAAVVSALCVGFLFAFVAMLHLANVLSRWEALRTEQGHLLEESRKTLVHAEDGYQDVMQALREVESGNWTTCSPAHIDAMRVSTFNHQSISEIGFIDGQNFLACTSWGLVDQAVSHGSYDFVRRDGVGIHLGVKPIIVRGKVTMAVNLGNHNALVDPKFLMEHPAEREVATVLLNEDGHDVAEMNGPAGSVVRCALSHPGHGTCGSWLYSSTEGEGWVSVAMEPARMVEAGTHRQQKRFLPLALVASAALVMPVARVARRRLSPLAVLRDAVNNGEFLPYYQPIMNIVTGRCVGAEALARWKTADGRLLSPDSFLPLAEPNGLLEPITDQIVGKVLQDMQAALRSDPQLHIAINLSLRDIETGRVLPLLAKLLAQWHLPARCLWLEATERGFLNVNAARKTLEQARQQGHVIAIDDFGTGYSSLSLLQTLPLDVLKVDKAFVDGITDAPVSGLVAKILELSADLGLEVIAEGIETEQQVRYLREHQVMYGQGFYFARPMSQDEFLAFYCRHRTD